MAVLLSHFTIWQSDCADITTLKAGWFAVAKTSLITIFRSEPDYPCSRPNSRLNTHKFLLVTGNFSELPSPTISLAVVCSGQSGRLKLPGFVSSLIGGAELVKPVTLNISPTLEVLLGSL